MTAIAPAAPTARAAAPAPAPDVETVIRDRVDEAGIVGHLKDFSTPRPAGTPAMKEAALLMQRKVQALGGWDVRVEELKGSTFSGQTIPIYNVVAERKGTAADGERKLVVAGAHLDTVPGAPGANDDASGSVGLLETAEALRDVPTKHDVRLVWFDGEEVGLAGAFAHVKANARDTARTAVMLQAEMLGSPHGKPVMLFGPRADAKVGQTLIDTAKQLGAPLEVSKDRPFGSDHNAFDEVGIPAMVMSTTAPPASRIMRDDPHYHSKDDTLANLNTASVHQLSDVLATSVYRYANA